MPASFLHRFSKARSRRHLTSWLDEAIFNAALTPEHHTISIGAGGEIDTHLRDLGLNILTVDIDPERKPDLLSSAENLAPLANASLDAVLCLEVLEHVADTQAAIRSIGRVLRPGGWLIGSTPFLLGIHDPPHDYYRFTEFGLRYLFRDFELVTLRPRNGYFDSIAVLLYRRFIIGDSSTRHRSVLLSPLLLLIGLLMEGLGKLVPVADGTTGYFFVCRKPAE